MGNTFECAIAPCSAFTPCPTNRPRTQAQIQELRADMYALSGMVKELVNQPPAATSEVADNPLDAPAANPEVVEVAVVDGPLNAPAAVVVPPAVDVVAVSAEERVIENPEVECKRQRFAVQIGQHK